MASWTRFFLISTHPLLLMHLVAGAPPLFSTRHDIIPSLAVDSVKAALCGNWMDDYAQVHRNIRAGVQPRKYVVNMARGGIADELSCMGSAFYFAVLTRRAFQIDEAEVTAKFSAAYTHTYIDWKYDAHEVEGLSTYDIPHFSTSGESPKGALFDTFHWGNLSTIGSNADVVQFKHCNLGIISDIFENPLYQSILLEMGLRPETAYGCMFHYLFQVLPQTKAVFPEEATVMMNESIVKIGIQVRAGDSVLKSQNLHEPSFQEAVAEVAAFSPHFECAQSIEDSLRLGPTRDVIWFLMSDSVFLRKSAQMVYGPKIMTNTYRIQSLRHIKDSEGDVSIMMYAAAEHWLYSLSDYFVFGHGGFGRSSALSSLKWTLYKVDTFGCVPVGIQQLRTIMPGV